MVNFKNKKTAQTDIEYLNEKGASTVFEARIIELLEEIVENTKKA